MEGEVKQYATKWLTKGFTDWSNERRSDTLNHHVKDKGIHWLIEWKAKWHIKPPSDRQRDTLTDRMKGEVTQYATKWQTKEYTFPWTERRGEAFTHRVKGEVMHWPEESVKDQRMCWPVTWRTKSHVNRLRERQSETVQWPIARQTEILTHKMERNIITSRGTRNPKKDYCLLLFFCVISNGGCCNRHQIQAWSKFSEHGNENDQKQLLSQQQHPKRNKTILIS